MAVRERVVLLLLLFALLAAFYTATFDFRGLTDTHLNSLQTRALVQHGDIDLARYGAHIRGYTVRSGPNVYSIYGVGISIVAAPFYGVLSRMGASEALLQGSVAVLIVAAAVALMFRLLLRLAPATIAAAGTLIFGFGTTLWPIAAMGLFLHGPVALFHVIGLSGLFSRRSSGPAIAGLAFGAATLVRSTSAIPLIIIGAFYLGRRVRPFAYYVLAASVPLAGIYIQNRWVWGSSISGGYLQVDLGLNGNIPRGIFQATIGWWRGLFVYSPVLILALLGAFVAMRNRKGFVERRIVFVWISSVVMLLLYARKSEWWGGLHQYGYRYLLDVVPMLVVLATWTWGQRERLRIVAAPLAALSILTMTFGASPNRFGWDGTMFPERFADAPIGQAWIVFFDRPWGSIGRLLGIGALGAVMWLMALRMEIPTERRLPSSSGRVAADERPT